MMVIRFFFFPVSINGNFEQSDDSQSVQRTLRHEQIGRQLFCLFKAEQDCSADISSLSPALSGDLMLHSPCWHHSHIYLCLIWPAPASRLSRVCFNPTTSLKDFERICLPQERATPHFHSTSHSAGRFRASHPVFCHDWQLWDTSRWLLYLCHVSSSLLFPLMLFVFLAYMYASP